MSLEKCLIEISNGSETAFDILYKETNKAVYHIILSILKNRTSSEDCMQEVYISIYKKASQYKKETNPKAWIYTIAKHTALNYYKKAKKEICYDIVDYADTFVAKDNFTNRDDIYLLKTALRELSEEDYQILAMCEIAGYKRREIAKMMSMPIATVTWKRNNALKVLKTYMEKNSKE